MFVFGSSPRKRMEAEGVQGEDGCLDIISKISLAVIDHYKLESLSHYTCLLLDPVEGLVPFGLQARGPL